MTTEKSPEGLALMKRLHALVRAGMHAAALIGGQDHRYWLLAWAFVRGFAYRRIEARHHIQTVGGKPANRYMMLVDAADAFEHNLPDGARLFALLSTVFKEAGMPGLDAEAVKAWLRFRAGQAIISHPPTHTPGSPVDLGTIVTKDGAWSWSAPPHAIAVGRVQRTPDVSARVFSAEAEGDAPPVVLDLPTVARRETVEMPFTGEAPVAGAE